MRAGLLTERITILTPIIIKNEYGEEETEWEVKYATRARLIHRSGNRTLHNDEVVYDYSKTLEVRDYVPVDEYDRIKWNNKIYRILDIEPNQHLMNKTINVELVND